MTRDIIVSVHMLSYNHVNTIRKAIEGVVNQKTKYAFELIIGDDASTDGTAEIIKEYAKKYPNIIKAVCRERNIGASENNIDTMRMCKGKYIAACEGDDVWIDELKLEYQIDFLEKNTDYSMCATKCIYVENGVKKEYPFYNNDVISKKDMMNHGNVRRYATCTVVVKNIYRDNLGYLDYYRNSYIGDLISQTLMIKIGKIHYIDRETAVYNRVVKEGDSFSAYTLEKQIELIKTAIHTCNNILNGEFNKEWNIYAAMFDAGLFMAFCKDKHHVRVFFHMLKSLNVEEAVYLVRQLIINYIEERRRKKEYK